MKRREVRAKLSAIGREVGADFLAFDGYDRLAIAQNGVVHAVGYAFPEIGSELGLYHCGIGNVVSKGIEHGQNQKELRALHVRASGSNCRQTLGDIYKLRMQFPLLGHIDAPQLN